MIPLHWVNSLSLYFCDGSHCILFTTICGVSCGRAAECKWLTRKTRGEERRATISGEIKCWRGGTTAREQRRRRGRNAMSTLLCPPLLFGALTASCLCVTLCGPSQTWAFLSHTHPIRAIIVLMIPFISVSLWMHLFSKVILYWLIVMDWLG